MKSEYYNKIRDNIYEYMVKKTVHDEKLLKLFYEMEKKSPDLDTVNVLYNDLKTNNVEGWIMLKAERLL
jgi:hypothetical protein